MYVAMKTCTHSRTSSHTHKYIRIYYECYARSLWVFGVLSFSIQFSLTPLLCLLHSVSPCFCFVIFFLPSLVFIYFLSFTFLFAYLSPSTSPSAVPLLFQLPSSFNHLFPSSPLLWNALSYTLSLFLPSLHCLISSPSLTFSRSFPFFTTSLSTLLPSYLLLQSFPTYSLSLTLQPSLLHTPSSPPFSSFLSSISSSSPSPSRLSVFPSLSISFSYSPFFPCLHINMFSFRHT